MRDVAAIFKVSDSSKLCYAIQLLKHGILGSDYVSMS